MSESDKKDLRRQQKLTEKIYKKPKISEEQRFITKSNKELKHKKEALKEEELWEDWEQDYR
jgi:hypothetical protein